MASYSPTKHVDKGTRRKKYRVRGRFTHHPETSVPLVDGLATKAVERTVVGEEAAKALSDHWSDLEASQRSKARTDRVNGTGAGSDRRGAHDGQSTPLLHCLTEVWLPHYESAVGHAQFTFAVGELRRWIIPELQQPTVILRSVDAPIPDRVPPAVATVGDITTQHLQWLRDQRVHIREGRKQGKPVGISTRNKIVGLLEALGRDLKYLGVMQTNIADSVKTVKLPAPAADAWEPDEFRAVAAQLHANTRIETGRGEWSYRPHMILMGHMSLRPSEGRGLSTDDVNHQRRAGDIPEAEVRRSVPPDEADVRCTNHPDEANRKGKTRAAWRLIPRDDAAMHAWTHLERFAVPSACECCGTPTRWLLCDEHGRRIDADNFRRELKRAAHQAGVRWLSTKNLRHYGVTRAIAAGLSPVVVMRFAGHSRLEQTLNTYRSYWTEENTEVRGALNGLHHDPFGEHTGGPARLDG